MALGVEQCEDPARALAVAGEFLETRPVHHNVLLSILHDRIALPEPGRYWVVTETGAVVGFALHSPPTFKAALAPAPRPVVDALVEAFAGAVPDLPGIIGEAATAAAFAGRWTERRSVSAVPEEGQRIYRLGRLVPARGVSGRLREATTDDRELLLRWTHAFHAETGTGPEVNEDTFDRRLGDGRVFVWEDGDPVSTAFATPPVAGVSRIGLVYTPRERRRRGYAGACVAALSQRVLDADADTCILYTQLHNATSNGVYRAIGYEAVSELLSYRFGTQA